jgi:hypothetical protein
VRRVLAGLALLLSSGCTYSATASRVDDLPDEERVLRVVEALAETPSGPLTAGVAPGPIADTLVLTLRAPLRSRCRVLVARRTRQELREAEVTYVPRRSLLKHGLAWSVGLAIAAPVWLPLHYEGCAADEAGAALERGSGGPTQDEAGGRFVARVDRAELAGEWVEDGGPVERDLAREGPLRGAVVRVRPAGGVAAAWTGRTDAQGRVVVPLRALVTGRGRVPEALEVSTGALALVVTVPQDAWAPGDPDGEPVDLDPLVARDGLEGVAQRLARGIGSGAIAPGSALARALPGLLRRRGAPLPVADAARPHVDAAARALRGVVARAEAPPAADLERVRQDLDAALRAQAGCWEAHRLLGLVARLAGDEERAARHLRVVLCLVPETSPLADRALTDLLPR